MLFSLMSNQERKMAWYFLHFSFLSYLISFIQKLVLDIIIENIFFDRGKDDVYDRNDEG